ncbi:MAG TPA: hypothetical protein VGG69_03995, partial [Rhizomicrobium sp.]
IEGLAGLLPGIRTIWIEMVDAADASGENDRIRSLLSAHGFVERKLAGAPQERNRLFVNRAMED